VDFSKLKRGTWMENGIQKDLVGCGGSKLNGKEGFRAGGPRGSVLDLVCKTGLKGRRVQF